MKGSYPAPLPRTSVAYRDVGKGREQERKLTPCAASQEPPHIPTNIGIDSRLILKKNKEHDIIDWIRILGGASDNPSGR